MLERYRLWAPVCETASVDWNYNFNYLTPGIAGTFLATLYKSFTCFGSGLLGLSSLTGG